MADNYNYYGFNYDINEHTGSMTIYTNDNEVVSEISDCFGMSKEELNKLADEVLFDLEYIKEPYFVE